MYFLYKQLTKNRLILTSNQNTSYFWPLKLQWRHNDDVISSYSLTHFPLMQWFVLFYNTIFFFLLSNCGKLFGWTLNILWTLSYDILWKNMGKLTSCDESTSSIIPCVININHFDHINALDRIPYLIMKKNENSDFRTSSQWSEVLLWLNKGILFNKKTKAFLYIKLFPMLQSSAFKSYLI